MIGAWKRQAMDGMASLFDGGDQATKASSEAEIEKLHAKIGQLLVERDFCASLRSMSMDRRRKMIEPDNPDLSITAQCRLLSISRSGYYYAPVPENGVRLALMAVIDQVFMNCPWYGSRQMARHLQRMGHAVGRRRVRRLMAKMGLAAIYQRPRTSDPHPEHRILPVPVARSGDHAAQSGVVRGCDLSADAARLPLSGGDHGLGHASARLAHLEHDGRRVLCRGLAGCHGPLWQTGDL
jgi:hypothetical protein